MSLLQLWDFLVCHTQVWGLERCGRLHSTLSSTSRHCRILGVSLVWRNACIVRKCLVESEGSALYGLYCDGLVSELLGSNEMSESSARRDGRTPNWVMNSFGNRNFMQAMGRPNLQSRCLAFCPIKFGSGSGVGGGFFWGLFPVSHYVPFKFPIISHHVLNMFPHFSMYSSTCSP